MEQRRAGEKEREREKGRVEREGSRAKVSAQGPQEEVMYRRVVVRHDSAPSLTAKELGAPLGLTGAQAVIHGTKLPRRTAMRNLNNECDPLSHVE